jgi:predicted MFS family arabinose efflux permease
MRKAELSPKLLWTLVITAAFTVGNIYLSQPLLAHIAQSFQRQPSEVGWVPALAQIGYVLGLIFVAPLGDVMQPRRLLIALLGVAAAMMVGSALAPSFATFCLVALGVGLSAVQAQVVLPFIASHSSEETRGRNMGLFMSACLTGVLLSRTLSGYLGEQFSWRTVYALWGLTMLGLAVVLYRLLPSSSTVAGFPGYRQLVGSLWTMARERRALRSISLTGALMYGALSVLWASLAFYVGGPSFGLGTDMVGAFGLLGVGGALVANLVGRHLDRLSARTLLLGSVTAMVLAYLGMGVVGPSLVGLVLSVILLDMGAQAANISNQSEIYRLYSDAQSRMNTIFKIAYFLGGAAGSALSTLAWQHYDWWGVCSVGIAFLGLAGWNVSRDRCYQRPAIATIGSTLNLQPNPHLTAAR